MLTYEIGAYDDDVVYLGTGNEIPGYLHVGHDRRPGGGGRLMVMCVDCRNHANFYALQPTGCPIGGFRLDRASYDDVDQSPAMLTVLRNIGEIAPAHMRASRDEMKAYYEVMIAQREGEARKTSGPSGDVGMSEPYERFRLSFFFFLLRGVKGIAKGAMISVIDGR